MSYILDALKKAEAERNLGAIPNLHAQTYAVASNATPLIAWRKPRVWLALTFASTAAIALAVVQPWSTPPVAKPPLMPIAAPTPAQPAVVAPVVRPAPAPSPSVTAMPIAKEPPQAQRSGTPVEKKPAPPAAAKTVTKTVTKTVSQSNSPQPTAAPPAAQQEPPVPMLRELPDNIQREIPQFVASGYIYSPNKADRTVLINQRLLREGDQVAPDLTLEKLTPSGMVLNYKGYRYRTSY